MIAESYVEHCQTLWSKWLTDSLDVSESLAKRFQLNHAPEPYLQFGDGSRPLHFLFTNPGAGMEHQRRTKIVAGESCVTVNLPYDEVARSFANYYEANLKGNAKIRINGMKSLCGLSGHDYVIQFESIPFHSAKLPGKRHLPDWMGQYDVLSEYTQELSHALRCGSLVALSAVGTSETITVDLIRQSPWLAWQAHQMDLDLDVAQVIPLVEKNGKTTCAFVYQRRKWTTGFVLVMGGNHFPAQPSLERMAELIV